MNHNTEDEKPAPEQPHKTEGAQPVDALEGALGDAFDAAVEDPQAEGADGGGMNADSDDSDDDEEGAEEGAASEGEGSDGTPEQDDPEEAARLAALATDLDSEAADEAPEGEIPVARIDEDALKVVRRLHHFGYEAYLVGGCVRDLLLGRRPKDFDVATSAEPNQIRQIFKNCRLIGRRFRLAHVYFVGGKVIETSTFRANPLDEMDDLPKDLLISQDNVFGTSLQDAQRRDFTVNALFYDPKTGKVVDHVGGRTDLDARIIRTIGDPDVRLREDPVRILRAVKFSARLDFGIDEQTRAAMTRHAAEISRCAAPRVLEEIYRLLACGSARQAFLLLMDLGILPILMPEIAPALGFAVEGGPPPSPDAEEAKAELLSALGALDACRERGVEPSHALSLGVLMLKLFHKLQKQGQDANRWVDDVSNQWVQRLRLTRRDRERLRLLLQAQRHLQPDRRRGGAARSTVRRGPFLEALLLYTVQLYSTGADLAEVGQWKAFAKAEGQAFRPGDVVDRAPREWGQKREGGRNNGHGGGRNDGGRRRRRGRRPGRR